MVTGVETGCMLDSAVWLVMRIAKQMADGPTFHHVLFDYLAKLLHVVF